MKEPLYARVIGWAIGIGLMCAAVLLLMVVVGISYEIVTYPQDTGHCPPDHVYIDYGETPQVGCWPEGVARELGVWPRP